MYTTLIVWLIIVLVVVIVVLLSKNNIVRLLVLASIIAVFFTTFSQFISSFENTKLETKITKRFEEKFNKLKFNEYKKNKNGKLEYKGIEYSVKELRSKLKFPVWLKPDLNSIEEEETLSTILAKNSARAIILGSYFLLISIVINIFFQILYLIYIRNFKRKK